MNNNTLVIIDGLSKILLIPVIAISLIVRKFFRLFKCKGNGKTLFIKLLGAGNLVACSGFMLGRDVEILTSLANKSTVDKFKLSNRAHYIDTSSLLSLLKSLIPLLRLYGSGFFDSIVNLESESIFAKFITASVPAVHTVGISNVYRSLLDGAIYDRYLVAPMMLPKSEAVEMLFSNKFESNKDVRTIISARQENFFMSNYDKIASVKKVVIAPSCSSTDSLRRLSNETWCDFFSNFQLERFECVEVVFPDVEDPQFQFFSKNITKLYPGVKIVVGGYRNFVNLIASSDLLITIDSQALHVAQQFGTLTIAFYGPTSPHGVGLLETTFPISRSMKCSPCTHKYFRPPCEGGGYCMNFDQNFDNERIFEIFKTKKPCCKTISGKLI